MYQNNVKIYNTYNTRKKYIMPQIEFLNFRDTYEKLLAKECPKKY